MIEFIVAQTPLNKKDELDNSKIFKGVFPCPIVYEVLADIGEKYSKEGYISEGLYYRVSSWTYYTLDVLRLESDGRVAECMFDRSMVSMDLAAVILLSKEQDVK